MEPWQLIGVVHPQLSFTPSLIFHNWAPPLLLHIFSLLLPAHPPLWSLSLSRTLCIKCWVSGFHTEVLIKISSIYRCHLKEGLSGEKEAKERVNLWISLMDFSNLLPMKNFKILNTLQPCCFVGNPWFHFLLLWLEMNFAFSRFSRLI
jgi:hypothetical protein